MQGHLIGRMAETFETMCQTESRATDTHAAVITKRYGELWVPEAAGYLQQMKVGGKEDESLVVQEIAGYFSITRSCIKVKLWCWVRAVPIWRSNRPGLNGTLLGCDVLMPDGR